MKKYLGYFIVVAFLVAVPFMSVAKQSLSDGEMGGLTAQEGVTIDFGAYNPGLGQFGNVAIENFAPALQSWGDGDGFNGYTDSGWVGQFTTMGYSALYLSGQMTIDVGSSGAVTAVQIGLPRALLETMVTDSTLKMGTGKTLSDSQPALGVSYNNIFAAILNPLGNNAITISAHTGEGVDVNFSPTGTPTTILVPGLLTAGAQAYMTSSWGDRDGWGAASTMSNAGYFGTRDMLVGDLQGLFITLFGTMSIDVGTDTTSGKTGVQIILPVINISTDGITQPLVLATNKQLTNNAQYLGTSYMGSVNATISGGMVITAH